MISHFDGPEGQEDMPYLLTFETVTTAAAVKLAMLADWSRQDPAFQLTVENVKHRAMLLVNAGPDYACILVPGSGRLALEAALATFASRTNTAHNLVLNNSDDAVFAGRILHRQGRKTHAAIGFEKGAPFNARNMRDRLSKNIEIRTVVLTHGDQKSGLLNPIEDLAQVAKEFGKLVIVDATNTIGALPLDVQAHQIDVLVGTFGRCLESVEGLSFVICRRDLLDANKERSPSANLDLHARWSRYESTGLIEPDHQTHAVNAASEALQLFDLEGGQPQRLERYERNRDMLVARFEARGFMPLLTRRVSGPMVQAFHMPADTQFDLTDFKKKMLDHGFLISGAQPEELNSFHIGIAGAIPNDVFDRALKAAEDCFDQMGVQSGKPVHAV